MLLPDRFDEELVVTDQNRIARVDDLWRAQALAVDEGSIFTFEIEQNQATFSEQQASMTSAYVGSAENNVVFGGPSDRDFSFVKRIAFSLAFRR